MYKNKELYIQSDDNKKELNLLVKILEIHHPKISRKSHNLIKRNGCQMG